MQYVGHEAAAETRLAAAMCEAGLIEDDLVTVLFLLSLDADPEIAEAAEDSFSALSLETIVRALSVKLNPLVIKKLYEKFGSNDTVLNMVALSENTPSEILLELAAMSNDTLLEIISYSPVLIGNGALLQALKENKSTLNTVLNHADVTYALAPEGYLAGEPLPESLTEEDRVVKDEEFENIYQKIQFMTVVDKIKLAMTGNKEARALLIRENNKMVARCVIRNPRISEDEVVKIAMSRNTSDEILREISRNEEWLKNYKIKKGLVTNPKTPIPISLKHMNYLRERDIRDLSKSRGVANVVRSAAKRLVDGRAHR